MDKTPADVGLPYTQVVITAADGVRLAAWSIPAAPTAPWAIYFHGNGKTIAGYLGAALQLHRLGLNVLLPEYRGYGESEGAPSEKGFYRDADASYRYLLAAGVPPHHIVVYGFSLGSGVAVDLASRVQVGALVVEAGYTSLPDVARSLYRLAPTALMGNRFASLTKLRRVAAPTLVLHAPDDRTVPFAQGRALFAAAPEPKHFLQLQGGHLGLLRGYGSEVWRDVGHFLHHQLTTGLPGSLDQHHKASTTKPVL